MIYPGKPTTLEVLEVNINRTIDEIRPEILEKVVIFETLMALNLLSQKKHPTNFSVLYFNLKFSRI